MQSITKFSYSIKRRRFDKVLRTFSWRLHERIITFSAPRNDSAVDLYFTTPMTTAQVVKHLGYPTRQCLERWLAKDPRYAGHMAKSIIPLEQGPRRSNRCRAACGRSGPPNGLA